jgi:hypothetical protein
MNNEHYPKQTQSNPIPTAHNPLFRSKTRIARSLSQAKLWPQLSQNFASGSFSSLHSGHALVLATAAPDQSFLLPLLWPLNNSNIPNVQQTNLYANQHPFYNPPFTQESHKLAQMIRRSVYFADFSQKKP